MTWMLVDCPSQNQCVENEETIPGWPKIPGPLRSPDQGYKPINIRFMEKISSWR